MARRRFSRRDFVKTVGLGAAGSRVSWAQVQIAVVQTAVDRKAFFSALGSTLIPSAPGDPGYAELERFDITEEVMKGLTFIKDEDLALFDETARTLAGKTFFELSGEDRAAFLEKVVGEPERLEDAAWKRIQAVYQATRRIVFSLFYQNYPYHRIRRNEQGIPLVDEHQISRPTEHSGVVSGWKIAGYRGPLSWEDEVAQRERAKGLHWHDDL